MLQQNKEHMIHDHSGWGRKLSRQDSGDLLSPKPRYCWWFRNPANQLRLVLYPIIFKIWYIPAGCLGFLPSTGALENGWLEYDCFLLARPICRCYDGAMLVLGSVVSTWLRLKICGLPNNRLANRNNYNHLARVPSLSKIWLIDKISLIAYTVGPLSCSPYLHWLKRTCLKINDHNTLVIIGRNCWTQTSAPCC